eukprot:363605-Chlamydomonas_euryale.AAC.1
MVPVTFSTEFQQSRMVLASEMKVLAPDLDPWLEAERGLDRLSDLDEDTRMKLCRSHQSGVGSASTGQSAQGIQQGRPHSPGALSTRQVSQVKTQLEDYLDAVAYKLRRRQLIKQRKQVSVLGTTMGTWGRERYGSKVVKVDAITFWVDSCILSLGSAFVLDLKSEVSCKGMHTLGFATAATTGLLSFTARSWKRKRWLCQSRFRRLSSHSSEMLTTMHAWLVDRSAAPEPRDVIWENLRMRAWLVRGNPGKYGLKY